MQTEFEWRIFPGFTTLDILEEIQNFMKKIQCEPEQFKDRIIFMSMYNDIVCEEQGNTENCEKNQLQLRIMLADFRAVFGHSWDLDQRNGTQVALINQTEIVTKLLNE